MCTRPGKHLKVFVLLIGSAVISTRFKAGPRNPRHRPVMSSDDSDIRTPTAWPIRAFVLTTMQHNGTLCQLLEEGKKQLRASSGATCCVDAFARASGPYMRMR